MPTADELRSRLQDRLALRTRSRAAAQRFEALFGGAGAAVLLGGIAVLAYRYEQLFEPSAWYVVGATVALLVPLVVMRRRWTLRQRRLAFAMEWIGQALRRLDDDFAFGQPDGGQYEDPLHPNSGDLDLFGRGSLYERLNSCRTALGRHALARRVAETGRGEPIAHRREAIEELAGNLDLREAMEIELCMLDFRGGEDERSREALERSTTALLEWMRVPAPPPPAAWKRSLFLVLGALATVALVVWATTDLGVRVLAPFYVLNAILLFSATDIGPLTSRVELLRETLEAWSRALEILETLEPKSALLARMRGDLAREQGSASQALRRLKVLTDRLSQRRNALWMLSFDVLWLWDLHVRDGLLQWKREYGSSMAGWIEAVADFEALCALGAYRAAVPDAVYAQVDEAGPPLAFEELAHPLLPAAARVGNSLTFDDAGTAFLVTGSNMSGKSTFLRTSGLAVVLSTIGLPVPARSLRMRAMQVATCMSVTDSLKDAASLFYAEVSRLRRCMDVASSGKLTLVLFDEILAGTNSRERHIGAVAILRKLLELPAVSLVSTHDLELAELAKETPKLEVVHFRDQVRDERMSFDYKLRPGVLPSTNALRVMRLAGLEVPEA